MKNCCTVLVRYKEGPGKPGWLEIKWYISGLFCDVDVNMLGGAYVWLGKNIEALVVAIKETGLDVSADKFKYMVYIEIRMHDEATM